MRLTAERIAENPYIPVTPSLVQLRFLALPHREAFYGGAAGGGKSEALLMASLMYVQIDGYAAILFRKTYSDLALEGALMDRAQDWLAHTDAQWRDKHKRWEFPGGGTLTFGYLDGPRDWRRYDSAEFQFVGFDEATQFRPFDLNALMQRLRRKIGVDVPTRMRYGSNPGGEAHDFLGERFVEPSEARPDPERAFVPALLEDNPHVDRIDYENVLESVKDFDELLYRQRRWGVWIKDEGESAFKFSWYVGQNRYRAEDTAQMWNRTIARYAALDTANEVKETSAYTSLTVGDLQPDYTMPLRYVARKKLDFPDLVDWTIEEITPFMADGKLEGLLIENKASGTQLIQWLRKMGPPWLRNLIIPVMPPKGGKPEAYKSAAGWMKRGMMPLPRPHPDFPWQYPFEKELFAVPNAPFADQADSASILVNSVEERTAAFSLRWDALQAAAEREAALVA